MRHERRRGGFCIFLGYNWCGPGCSGPGTPINEVDVACKQHDECYQRIGDYCKCDRIFLEQLRSQMNPYTQEGRQARLIHQYMSLQATFNCVFRRNDRYNK